MILTFIKVLMQGHNLIVTAKHLGVALIGQQRLFGEFVLWLRTQFPNCEGFPVHFLQIFIQFLLLFLLLQSVFEQLVDFKPLFLRIFVGFQKLLLVVGEVFIVDVL